MLAPPTLPEIERAAATLRDVIVRTPLLPLHGRGDQPAILLKLETLQPVTNFKIRGVYHAVAALSPDERARGLSTVSAGNTAQALAWTGRRFRVPARSLMPDTAPATKIEAVRRYGGEAVLVPVDEVFRFLETRGWEREPYAFVHPWIERDVMIGHGTIGPEILADCPDVETVYVPVGGGGLIGGVGSALKQARPGVRVVAVEPEGCPALRESFERGEPARVACRTICDGVAVPYITEELFPLLREIVDDVELVAEQTVRDTIRRLAVRERVLVEGSAALPVAAALASRADRRGRCVCIVSGASIDPALLAEILA